MPSILSVTTNISVISDNNVGAGNFTITINYSEAMNTSSTPVIVFSSSVMLGTLTLNTTLSSWLDADTYRMVYDVSDQNSTRTDVDFSVSGASDLAAQLQNTSQFLDVFSSDTENPIISSAIMKDVDSNGIVDTIEIKLSESIAVASAGQNGFNLSSANNHAINNESVNPDGTDTLLLEFNCSHSYTAVGDLILDFVSNSNITDLIGNRLDSISLSSSSLLSIQDVMSPVILSTSPVNGATNVLKDSQVVINFSEPMLHEISLSDNDSNHYLSKTWSNSSTTLTAIHRSFTPGASVTVNINAEAEFGDPASLSGTSSFSFKVKSEGTASVISPARGQGGHDFQLEMGRVADIGNIDQSGINYLSYVGSKLIIKTAVKEEPSVLLIKDLDLINKKLIVLLDEKEIVIGLSQKEEIDIDEDTQPDLFLEFKDLLVNRVELTIKDISNPVKNKEQLSNKKETLNEEKALVLQNGELLAANKQSALVSRLSGLILLQVEDKGKAWYFEPISEKLYFMGRPEEAFYLMQNFGLGISQRDLGNFINSGAPRRLSGRILLAVESRGEAYYVNPLDLKLYYLSRPADAFKIMKNLSLGISNDDFDRLVE